MRGAARLRTNPELFGKVVLGPDGRELPGRQNALLARAAAIIQPDSDRDIAPHLRAWH